MKKYFTCIIFFVAVYGMAQDFQGIAEYESKMYIDFDGAVKEDHQPVTMDPAFEEAINKAMEKKYILRFDKTQSLYEEEERIAPPSGDGGMQINFAGSGKQYISLRNKTYTVESDIFDKDFLIVDQLQNYNWTTSAETKKIGNYTCYKATAVIPKKTAEYADKKQDKKGGLFATAQNDIVITAWYTTDIPVNHGPEKFWGLPGLILEVNDGTISLLCSRVTLNPKEKLQIKPLKKGKQVTQEEFDKIMEEKTNELMQDQGRPGEENVIIKMGG